jgi:predicted TIM-barrel fold metal-dependent hydrolase
VTPLFDSLTHPSLSGTYLGKRASFELLAKALDDAGFTAACAVGMPDDASYEHEAFARECGKHPVFVPIAPINPHLSLDVASELDRIRSLGFRGIKVHPRFAKHSWAHPRLPEILREAASRDLRVLLCTYTHCGVDEYPADDPFYQLVRLLKQAPDALVMLVHGGDVRLLEYAELVRFNGRLLLDLSLTMMKYQGSSIDADVRFLFSRFDRRICVGSDAPDYPHAAVRARFEEFAADLPEEKRVNIANRNLSEFFGLDEG